MVRLSGECGKVIYRVGEGPLEGVGRLFRGFGITLYGGCEKAI